MTAKKKPPKRQPSLRERAEKAMLESEFGDFPERYGPPAVRLWISAYRVGLAATRKRKDKR